MNLFFLWLKQKLLKTVLIRPSHEFWAGAVMSYTMGHNQILFGAVLLHCTCTLYPKQSSPILQLCSYDIDQCPQHTTGWTKKKWDLKNNCFHSISLLFLLHYWALLGPTRPYWALLGSTGPYWALLGLTGPYRALLGLTQLVSQSVIKCEKESK